MAEFRAVAECGRIALQAAIGLLLVMPAAFAQGTPPAGYATQRYTPPDFQLPEGRGCSGDIARWQAIQANDYASGNVAQRVYAQIQGEIGQAAALCRAGRDNEARRAVAQSRRRHGYPG